MNKSINNKEKEYFSSFGYNYFGKLLNGFSHWLREECSKNKIKTILFLSRDGYILKKAFDEINNNEYKTIYFYASRRALIVPCLNNIKKAEDIFEIYSFKKKFTVFSLIKKMGIEDLVDEKDLKKFNINFNTIIQKNNIHKNIFSFINSYIEIVKKNSRNELNSFKEYIDLFKLEDRIAIVDIGWNGTMQNALNTLFLGKTIYGYYLGVNPSIKNKMIKGYMFSYNNNENWAQKIFSFTEVLEFMTLAHHGSVKRYIGKNNIDFYKYEYKDVKEDFILNLIQENAIKYIKENKMKNTKIELQEIFKRFLKPNFKDIRYFGKLIFSDDIIVPFADPKSIFYYIFHLNQLKKDYMESKWKVAFMKKLLKVPLPYYRINMFLRKRYLERR